MRRISKSPARRAWSIEFMANAVADAALQMSGSDVDRPLVLARIADHYRCVGVTPLPMATMESVAADLDGSAWRRLGIIAGMLDFDEARAPLGDQPDERSLHEQLEQGLVGTAKSLAALDLPILARSMIRAEEFARRLAFGLNIPFEGEEPSWSAKRLQKIDYQRLLGKVDAAKASAEEQMDALMRHQERDDQQIERRRRGKW
jgi:hypothetical protein